MKTARTTKIALPTQLRLSPKQSENFVLLSTKKPDARQTETLKRSAGAYKRYLVNSRG